MKRDLGQKSASASSWKRPLLSHSPYELGDLILCPSLVLKSNLCIAPVLLLESLADCGFPEDGDFVLLIFIPDELAVRLGIFGFLHTSLVISWQFTLGLCYSLRAAHRVILRL